MDKLDTLSHIIDISIPITGDTVVYPNNPLVHIEETSGATSIHSTITMGSHTATHIDAPRHALEGAAGIEAYPLERFVGPARVLDCTQSVRKISAADLSLLSIQKGERLLFKTANSARGFSTWYDDYVYLDGDAAVMLAGLGVALVGIDALSIKQRGSEDLRPHTALLSAGIPIIEGLDLSQVAPGAYTLISLPLNLPGLDGSPTRAVLITA